MNYLKPVANTLKKFRSPFSRSTHLVYPYAFSNITNYGITLSVPNQESIIAPTSGYVARIWESLVDYCNTDETLISSRVICIEIRADSSVTCILRGLYTLNVTVGKQITRGDLLGSAKGSQIHFSIYVDSKPVDPLAINSQLKLQSGAILPSQAGKIRYAPDILPRDLSNGVTSVMHDSKRYFSKNSGFLLNIDFNGNGTTIGNAAIGNTPTDYWNVYAPLDFTSTETVCNSVGYGYGYGYADYGYNIGHVFSSNPLIPLLNSDNTLSLAMLERVPPLTSDHGAVSGFSSLMSTYLGGESCANTFNLRNVPEGSYILYVYSNSATTSTSYIYASANGDTPTRFTLVNEVVSSYVENKNYIKLAVNVNFSRKVSFAVYGYLSGIQLLRV
jgi:hypothetical protein